MDRFTEFLKHIEEGEYLHSLYICYKTSGDIESAAVINGVDTEKAEQDIKMLRHMKSRFSQLNPFNIESIKSGMTVLVDSHSVFQSGIVSYNALSVIRTLNHLRAVVYCEGFNTAELDDSGVEVRAYNGGHADMMLTKSAGFSHYDWLIIDFMLSECMTEQV